MDSNLRWKDIGVMQQPMGHFAKSTSIQTPRQLADLADIPSFASINGEIAIRISL